MFLQIFSLYEHILAALLEKGRVFLGTPLHTLNLQNFLGAQTGIWVSKIPWICHGTDLSATIHIILEEHREGMLDSNKTINNHQV